MVNLPASKLPDVVDALAALESRLDARLAVLEAQRGPLPPARPADTQSDLTWLRAALRDPKVNVRLVLEALLDVIEGKRAGK